MKKYTVKIEFLGLAGTYFSNVDVEARNPAAAKRKASRVIGNRDGYIVDVKECY